MAVSFLRSGETISSKDHLKSGDGRFWLVMGPDGNLVLTALFNTRIGRGEDIWATRTNAPPNYGSRLMMLGDGNLVIVRKDGSLVWQTGTGGHPGAYLYLQNDGNLMVIDENAPRGDIWRTGTDMRERNDEWVVPGQLTIAVTNATIFNDVETGVAPIANEYGGPISIVNAEKHRYVHCASGEVAGFARTGTLAVTLEAATYSAEDAVEAHVINKDNGGIVIKDSGGVSSLTFG